MDDYVKSLGIKDAKKASRLIATCKEARSTIKFDISDLLFDGVISLGDVVVIVARVLTARANIEAILLKNNCYDDDCFKAVIFTLVQQYIPDGFGSAFVAAFDAAWFLLSEAPPKVRASCHC
jgi:hypothetical protein